MPFLVVEVKLSGNSFNDRDLSLLNSVKYDSHSITPKSVSNARKLDARILAECPLALDIFSHQSPENVRQSRNYLSQISEMSASTGIN